MIILLLFFKIKHTVRFYIHIHTIIFFICLNTQNFAGNVLTIKLFINIAKCIYGYYLGFDKINYSM